MGGSHRIALANHDYDYAAAYKGIRTEAWPSRGVIKATGSVHEKTAPRIGR